jgi:uncharacterized protein YraI
MKLQLHRPRARSRRTWALAAATVMTIGAFSASPLDTTAAYADPTAYTLIQNTPESWGPNWNYSSFVGSIDVDTEITISCYLTGDTVTGPYGSENVWDMVSGSPDVQLDTGTFVPDAYIYTSSNSPVVPRCPAALGRILGNVQVTVYGGPGYNYHLDGYVSPGVNVAIKCYSTGTTVSGPYGSENIWDRTTRTYPASAQWVPDALVYTGSNSAVVPHC